MESFYDIIIPSSDERTTITPRYPNPKYPNPRYRFPWSMFTSRSIPLARGVLRQLQNVASYRTHVIRQHNGAANPLTNPIYRIPPLATRMFSSRHEDEQPSTSSTKLLSAMKIMRESMTQASTAYHTIATSRYGRLMRLDKPVGTTLLFLPAAWSIAVGTSSISDGLHLTALFYAGSMLLRGLGCTINDIWDADIDRRVTRTQNRPTASGEISTTSAFLFMGAQGLGGLIVLSQLNTESFLVASLAVLPVMFYPFAKRLTKHPQVVLGLTFNLSAIVGGTAATGTITPETILLYGAGWFWTMIYDTIYAHQDKRDDESIGVSSTALSFGERPTPILALFAAGKMACLVAVGLLTDMSCPYYACISATGLHLARQIALTDLSDPKQCQQTFDSNATAGMITWLGVILGRIM